jgi:cellulose synthase (UDP-forming)
MTDIGPQAIKAADRAGRFSEVNVLRLLIGCSAGLLLCFGWVAYTAFAASGAKALPFVGLILGLFYCALCYQIFRYGAARRAASAHSPTPAQPDPLLTSAAPLVTILIPSFKEERRVILATVLSAALAVYRNKRIVVLVDDPQGDTAALLETQAAIAEIAAHLSGPRRLCAKALSDPALDGQSLSHLYSTLADWLTDLAATFRADQAEGFAHVDDFLIDKVLLPQAHSFRLRAVALLQNPPEDMAQERDHLASLFSAEISSFHRKAYANLSADRNKAMNLNAYIGLMGGSFTIWQEAGQIRLVPATDPEHADLVIPQSSYIMTLDADSIVLPDYLLTLVGILERDPTAAVAQTPYLTFPGSKAAVEYVAGATTDIQYLIHQGSSHFGSAYWVGANAVLRHKALQDIATSRHENGHDVQVFIQDKTVIEDTGSTIDLWRKGWHVHNHFAPLAYSATPADFGALAIQRKRWGNGGLILFADLFRDYLRKRAFLSGLPRLVLRAHYLLSPVIGNIGILLLMVWSTSLSQSLLWVPFFMLPYFLLYSYDLTKMGYRKRDIFAVCSLNLMLLPVNLSGLLASLRQIVFGRKDSFLRTPKIALRSRVPASIFLFNAAIFALMILYVVEGLSAGDLWGAVIPMINVSLYGYGLFTFLGLRDSLADLLSLFSERVPPLAKARIPSPFALRKQTALVFTLTFLAFSAVPFNSERNAANVLLPPNPPSILNEGAMTR